eukprot:9468480-Pyramimonas_sp.AAC.1
MEGNMRNAHRYLKRSECLEFPELCLDPDDRGVITNPQSVVEARAKQWKTRWAKHDDHEGRVHQMRRVRDRALVELQGRAPHIS